jgi:hypothetical protein
VCDATALHAALSSSPFLLLLPLCLPFALSPQLTGVVIVVVVVVVSCEAVAAFSTLWLLQCLTLNCYAELFIITEFVSRRRQKVFGFKSTVFTAVLFQ